MKTILLSLLGVLCVGCGSRHPMDGRGSIIYWVIGQDCQTSPSTCGGSTIAFANCADDPQLRAQPQFQALPLQSLFAYRLAKDGTTATVETCTQDTSNCASVDANGNPIDCAISCADGTQVLQVAGDELLMTVDDPEPIQGTNPVCNVDTSEDWELTDQGPTLQMTVVETLTLTGDPTSCSQFDASEKAASPNGKGVQGCVLTLSAEASYSSQP